MAALRAWQTNRHTHDIICGSQISGGVLFLFFNKQNKAAISILNMSLFDYLEYAASVAVPFEKKTLSSYYTIIRGSGNAVYTEI